METRWPPRSPQEALLSSPSGRKKLRMYQNRTSPTPSPLKNSATTARIRNLQPAIMDEDEDDEETLQLRLEALEARLKLKKLQQKKSRAAAGASTHCEGGNESELVSELKTGAEYGKDHANHEYLGTKAGLSAAVQVTVSPQKRSVTKEARSPGRILLGIDKGLKGRNVSLKRPPNDQTKKDPLQDPFGRNVQRDIPRCISDLSAEGQFGKSKTFSEKIAEIRQQDKQHKERSNKLRKQRSAGFGVQQCDLEEFKNAASTIELAESDPTNNKKKDVQFSRDEVLRAVNKPVGGLLGRSDSVSGVRNSRIRETPRSPRPTIPKHQSHMLEKSDHEPSAVRMRSITPPVVEVKRSNPTPGNDPLLEHFSSIQLSKRLIPQAFLTKTFAGKHISNIPSLLATIKSPTYELPAALESDFVVLGVIASKSSPLSHKDAHKSTGSSVSTSLTEATDSVMNTRGKYMVFTLTDLKWSLDLFLFTTAYTRFWKLTPGTLIAILNPSIMPPPPGKADTGRFSLVLNSSDDTILEIGTSRDLGWCKSVRKDGKACGSWVDKRRTEFCEWHVDRVVESTRRGRMEVNGMSAPYAPGGKRGGRTGFWGAKGRKSKEPGPGNEDGLIKEGPQWDRATASRYFIAPSATGSRSGRSAASLLDAEHTGGGAYERGGSRDERLRKRLAEQQREREIARQLGENGNGIGKEYLKVRQQETVNNPNSCNGNGNGRSAEETPSSIINSRIDGPKLGAEELGLKGRAHDVKLGSVRKRLLDREDKGVEGSSKKLRITKFGIERGVREGETMMSKFLGKDGRGRKEEWNNHDDNHNGHGYDDDDDDDDDEDGLEII